MKYTFEKKDEDTTILKYKEKEFTFTKDIATLYKMQSINFTAKNEMIMDLAKKGMTLDNLIIKKVQNGKKYEDETNVITMENNYKIKITLEIFNEICRRFTNMDLQELMSDIGITEQEESELFGKQIKEAIIGTSTPSEEK